jgi:membrane associated rhomboid family serine protease
MQIIRQYRLENRGWSWRHSVFHSTTMFDWTAIIWVMLIGFFFWLDLHLDVRSLAAASSVAVRHGEWWRIFTAIWLHADVPHLAANAAFGSFFLALSMARYGFGPGLLAAYLAGAGANLFRCLVSLDNSSSLGASGMVMGAVGLVANQSFWLWRKVPRMRPYIIGGIVSGLMIFTLFGVSPGTDVIAHFGGLVLGLLLGMLFARKPTVSVKPVINWACALIFAALVIVPWLLAIRVRGGS